MKKVLMLATAALLITGSSFAQDKKQEKATAKKECGKDCKDKDCCKKDAKSTKTATSTKTSTTIKTTTPAKKA